MKIGAAWIALRGGGVVVGIVPVAAPLVDVVANVVETEGIGSVTRDGLGSGLPAGGVIRERLRRSVAPRKIVLFEVAAGGAFPLGFGGKAVGAAGLASQR